MRKALVLLALVSCGLIGCSGGADVKVSKEQEAAFRNPPKDIPPDIAEQMRKGREEAAKQAQERMRQSQGAPQSTGQ